MKKFCLLFVMLVMLSLPSMVSANSLYDDHLGGDDNYILIEGHMGGAWYIDRSSLVVQKYAPPQYIIAVNIVEVPNAGRGDNTISKVRTYRFFYNWDLRQAYVDRGSDNWQYVPSEGSRAETMVTTPASEMAFYLAYNMRFYNNYYSDFYYRAK